MTDTTQLPDLATRRQMLEAARDDFRRQGFTADIQAAALLVQAVTPAEKRAHHAQVEEYRRTADNARSAAARMQEMLDELPADGAKD